MLSNVIDSFITTTEPTDTMCEMEQMPPRDILPLPSVDSIVSVVSVVVEK